MRYNRVILRHRVARSTPTKYEQGIFPDFFERPTLAATLVHDEIWPEQGRARFEGHGVAYIADGHRYSLFKRLHRARHGHPYEISFKKISKDRGKPFEIAREWLAILSSEVGRNVAFKAAFTDHEAEYFKAPYKGDPGWLRHLRHSVSLPVLGVPVFALREYDHLDVAPVFDGTGNLKDKDAFSSGLALASHRARTRRVVRRRHYPTLDFHPIEYVSSDPLQYSLPDGTITDLERRIDCEFVQLVDVALGSFRAALDGNHAGKFGRIELASDVARVLADLWNGPWHRYTPRARSFTLTVWPDEFGLPYNPKLYVARDPARQELLWKPSGRRAA